MTQDLSEIQLGELLGELYNLPNVIREKFCLERSPDGVRDWSTYRHSCYIAEDHSGDHYCQCGFNWPQ